MKKVFVVLVLLSLVGTATAQDRIYILGNRNVYMEMTTDSAGQAPVIIDCQIQNNFDPIGCIIAANSVKEKQTTKKRHYDVKKVARF